MPISHLLEDFGALRAPQGAGRTLDEEELEDFRLAAFEQGYSAGWEDSVKAQTEDQNRVSAELARNLEDLSFTYHEAVNQLMLSTEPVFRALVERVLPQTLAQQFGGHILERIRAVTEEEVARPVTLAVAPGEGAAVRALRVRPWMTSPNPAACGAIRSPRCRSRSSCPSARRGP